MSGDIYLVNADRTGVARITDGSVWDFAPAWSPDGTKIAFSRENTNNAPADVYVMNADGSAQTNLTNNIAFDSHPAGRRTAPRSHSSATVRASGTTAFTS